MEVHAQGPGHFGQLVGEDEAITGFVMGQAQTARNAFAGAGQSRLGGNAAIGIEHLEWHAVLAQHLDILVRIGHLLGSAEQLQGTLGAVIIGDAGVTAQRIELVAAIFCQAHHARFIGLVAFRGAIAQNSETPGNGFGIEQGLDDQRRVAHEQPFERLLRNPRPGPGRRIAG